MHVKSRSLSPFNVMSDACQAPVQMNMFTGCCCCVCHETFTAECMIKTLMMK